MASVLNGVQKIIDMQYTIKEEKILEKIELINGTMVFGMSHNQIDPLFYEQCRIYLDELKKMCIDKFKGDIR